MGICKLLPEYMFSIFNSSFTKTSIRQGVFTLSGEESFHILQTMLKQQLAELELQEELFFDHKEKSTTSKYDPKVNPRSRKVMNLGVQRGLF